MSKLMRGRLTFSNVVAILALFIALGGSAYAATKFSGKQIKPKTIPANRIKPGSLTSTQIKDSSLKSVKSAQGLSTVTYSKITVQINGGGTTTQTITSPCPPNTKALGGGALSSDPDNGAFFNDGSIASDGSSYIAHIFPGAATSTVTVTAACVAVG